MKMKSMSLLGLLSACSAIIQVPDIPMVQIVREPSGAETVLTGFISPQMDFSSTFVTSSDKGIECRGSSSNKGAATVDCTNGWRMNFTAPKELYGKPDGSYATISDGIGVAVGWGEQADEAVLRSLF